MRTSIFENDPESVVVWIRENYTEDITWAELNSRFREFSKDWFGVSRSFHAAYSWATRRGLLSETREGVPICHRDKEPQQSNGEVATLVEILYSLDSLTSEQKFAAAKELIKD